MTPRISHFVLIAAVLLVVNACSSTTPRQDVGIPTYEPAPVEDFSKLEPDPFGLQRDPADRSLAEVEALSASMLSYQPDLVLEIIRSLESLPSSQLNTLIVQQNLDPEFTEWLELTLQIRTVVIGGSSSAIAAEHWANYHYGHVVDRSHFSELVTSYRMYFQVPSRSLSFYPRRAAFPPQPRRSGTAS